MKKFQVKIGYEVSYKIKANNEVSAEEKALDIFHKTEPHEFTVKTKELRR